MVGFVVRLVLFLILSWRLRALGGIVVAKKPYIKIKPSRKGSFTAAAKRAGRSVRAEASAVLADPKSSKVMRKKAQFAKNAAKFKH